MAGSAGSPRVAASTGTARAAASPGAARAAGLAGAARAAGLAGAARAAGSATAVELIDRAVAAGVVPGAVLAAGCRGPEPLLRHVAGDAQRDAAARRPMTADTVFDLASLTKVVATLPALLHLAGRGGVGLDHPVRRYLPAFAGTGKDEVTVRHLLLHTSGLPGSRKYYRRLRDPAEIRAAALAEPLVARAGTVFCYSDVGFITLGELAAAVSGGGIDELVRDVVCAPLGMTTTRYRPPASWGPRIAATEPVRGRAKVGVVHDENAEAMGGVAGHAGLFGTAADLARYAAAWAGNGPPAWAGNGPPAWSGDGSSAWAGNGPPAWAGNGPPAWAADGPPGGLRDEALRCQTDGLGGGGRRGLGWGLRGDVWDNMGDGWPSSGAGHTGFTGTSLSVDPRTGLWAVLLTNAVHFGRGPEHSVVGLRKQVHAAVAAELLG
jgi:CubicO group peptidase (beta-lactamase class C family)